MIKTLLSTFFLQAILLVQAQTYPSYDMGISTSATDTAGYLHDPGGDSLNYNPDTDVTFTITTSNNKPINMSFIMFDMEPDLAGTGTCGYDYVEVYDAATADPTALVGMYCGNNTPPDFTSSSNALTIHFFSDGGSETPGFKMFWTTGEVPDIEPEYCAASGTCTASNRRIINVTLADLNNDSQCENGGYADFTDQIANVNIGEQYLLNVTISAFNNANYVYAWIDFNHDGGFTVDEKIVLTGDLVGQAAFLAGAVNVPATANLGLTRMRVRSTLPPDPGLGLLDPESPCGTHTYGEVEDYSVLISDPANPFPECAGYVYPANLDNTICTSFNFTWNPATTGTTITYHVQLWDNTNTLIIDEQGWPNNSYPINNLSPNSDYVGLVTSYNENGQAYGCDSVRFSTSEPHPEVLINERKLTVCQGTNADLNLTINNGTTISTYDWFDLGTTQLVDSTIAPATIKTASTTGSYPIQIQVIDDRGCASNIDSIVFNIDPSPVSENLSISKANFCFDESFELTYLFESTNMYEYSIDGISNWISFNPDYINDSIFLLDDDLPIAYFRVIENLGLCSSTSNMVVGNKYPPVAAPVVARTLGDSVNCDGDMVELTVTNHTQNISWSSGESTVSMNPTITDTYTATYTDNNNCQMSTAIHVVFHETPAKPEISMNLGAFQTTNNSDYYLWIKDGVVVAEGQGLSDFTPTENGLYRVVAKNAFNCADTSDVYNLTNVSIAENSKLDFSFYPNPTKENITLISSTNNDIQIIGIDGQVVFTSKVSIGVNNIVLDLAKGAYFVKQHNATGVQLQGLIIE